MSKLERKVVVGAVLPEVRGWFNEPGDVRRAVRAVGYNQVLGSGDRALEKREIRSCRVEEDQVTKQEETDRWRYRLCEVPVF